MSYYNIIGIMSGTSLDGVDISYCKYTKSGSTSWSFELFCGKTYDYPDSIVAELQNPFALSASRLAELHTELGGIYGDFVNQFIKEFNLDKNEISAIASHGQTIFHQPDKGFTTQIGCGTKMAVVTGLQVINDFRSKDVYLGGQGAPLVPVGDFLLFKERADAFLNIGGFCNISFQENGKIVAFDICAGNLPLNKLALNKGLKYDKNGDLARTGEINFFLLGLLNALPYYEEHYPKSLGVEWLEMEFYPLIKFDKEIENNIRTIVEHIAMQLSDTINKLDIQKVLVTGGGAKNSYLIERLQQYCTKEIVIPSEEIIDLKEAIIFGFLGALYLQKDKNVFKSVTGALNDSVSGTLHLP
ncbi:MAG TPA: anhydro-N-acetylmuramic acid kinase [Crocinitomicaceae bacterium]|nr:anhydro-N-acetylmuramic acid kinase [Crocinitomicaceae bacterium]